MVHGHGPRSHCKGHNHVIFPRAWPHHLRRLEQARPSGPKGREENQIAEVSSKIARIQVRCSAMGIQGTQQCAVWQATSCHATPYHVTSRYSKIKCGLGLTEHDTAPFQIRFFQLVFVTVTVRISISKFITWHVQFINQIYWLTD